jgi:N-acetylneuraminic acid mutarotase
MGKAIASVALSIIALTLLSACQSQSPSSSSEAVGLKTPSSSEAVGLKTSANELLGSIRMDAVPAMPIALTNNAVAAVNDNGVPKLYSFFGLSTGKTHSDITRTALEFSAATGRWEKLADVPVEQGRLASIAAVLGSQIYLFGGYTVASDGKEVSTPDVLRFDPSTRSYQKVAPMPTPVDDSVALAHNNGRIYLISGWHQDKNVNLVQIYDSEANQWSTATDFPGTPVFGHGGAIIGNRMMICDGVRLDVINSKRTFSASAECWQGEIDARDVRKINWTRATHHGSGARYRMAVAADPARNYLIFAGGSTNPYNFDGVGYNGTPSPASARVDAFDLGRNTWIQLPDLPQASMDHRGLLQSGESFYVLGGMRDGQAVSAEVLQYRLQQ